MGGYYIPAADVSNLNFTLDIYKASSDTGNLLISPVCLQILLGIWYIGARSNTREQIDQALPQPWPNTPATTTTQSMNDTNGQLEFNAKVYYQIDFAPKQGFINKLRDYQATYEPVTFSNEEETRNYINTWIKNTTHSGIEVFFNQGYIPSDTKLAILSTTYFHGEWVNPFDGTLTRNTTFYVSESTTAEVETLFTTSQFKYSQIPELDCAALLLPFKHGNVTLLVLLPTETLGLANVVRKLENKGLAYVLSTLQNKYRVNVQLPKFHISCQENLQQTLETLQITDAFNAARADFGNISDNALKVDKCNYKALIEINESGATAVGAYNSEIRPTSPRRNTRSLGDDVFFQANHPFLFFLLDVEKLVVYFGGRYADPQDDC